MTLTHAIGAFNGGAQKDIATRLSRWGIADTKKSGIGLLEGVTGKDLAKKRKKSIIDQVKRLAKRYKKNKSRRGIKAALKFALCKQMYAAVAKNGSMLSADHPHWADKGWIKPSLVLRTANPIEKRGI